MNSHVIFAVFRRNFFSYFSNPTGYVFICLFVILSSFAAFWPNDFFVANLANLDQLNKYLPMILLVFIPAITMSIWAEERRQGTDELLLTIPAADTDIVIGKYLAAVAIYSVALLFSLICNMIMLSWLGRPDLGLFFATYFGHWIVGLAMLAIGMVASFLTGNLTVGFVLGVIFNIPLVLIAWSDTVIPGSIAPMISRWSVADQFRDFGRGVISLGGVVYFLAIVVSMLYLSVVLISRRHWGGGRHGADLGLHYFLRTVALIAGAVALVMICDRSGLRADMSSERLNSLSPQTRKLIGELNPKEPVLIDAYISPEVPESYVQTRLNLVNALREFQAMGRGKVQVRMHSTTPNSDEAALAEKLYGITPRRVDTRSSGVYKMDEVFLAAAFNSGLNKVVVPFFDTGIPVEYEVARSIATVGQQTRKKLGVIQTDAQLFAGFDMNSGTPTRNQLLIDELEKQYDVKQVNMNQPLNERFDVLLAVQPSSLGPEQMDNFIEAVRGGTPTAIFEDPFPYLAPNVPATSAPKQAPQMGMFGGGQPPQPKGNLSKLLSMLGVDIVPDHIIWQKYNPYKRFDELPPEFIFIDHGASRDQVFNSDDPISSGLQEMLFIFPGAVAPLNNSKMKFKPLVMTGADTGYVTYGDMVQRSMFGGVGGLNPRRNNIPTREHYSMAAHITGTPADDQPMSDAEPEKGEKAKAPAADKKAPADKKPAPPPPEIKPTISGKSIDTPAVDEAKPSPVNVVIVSDIDLLYSEIFNLRAQSNNPDRGEMNWNLDNVTFVLNVLDELAGDDRFIDIRKRRPKHRTLERVDLVTAGAREAKEKDVKKFKQLRDEAVEKMRNDMQAGIDKIQNSKGMSQQEIIGKVQQLASSNQRRLDVRTEQLEREYQKKMADSQRKYNLEEKRVQTGYKLMAVLLPPILPLVVGLAVYFNRRAGEREGVASSRLR
jgi:ABC-2 type transport system permease protein